MDLKPCPFCGKKEVSLLFFEKEESAVAYVKCPSCGATGSAVSESKEEAQDRMHKRAAALWNHRTEAAS